MLLLDAVGALGCLFSVFSVRKMMVDLLCYLPA